MVDGNINRKSQNKNGKNIVFKFILVLAPIFFILDKLKYGRFIENFIWICAIGFSSICILGVLSIFLVLRRR